MASVLDPLRTADRIDRDYRSYLTSTFAPSDGALRADFDRALVESGRTRKGPYVQATPPYTPGASARQLVDDGILRPEIVEGGTLPADRALYAHQEEAIRKLSVGRNLIVATGTGSGKTECYLTPILNHLLDERTAGTLDSPGVRALLLYPMNALANDQLKRIREFFAGFPDITFGRYTGETENDPARALDKYRQQLRCEPPPNELIDRQRMQVSPPHVLVTNFAMLEYLLLRPTDSNFFDGPTGDFWRYLVLDEIHVYDGAKGSEIGMLLRRVRDRVRDSRRGELTCIGTSATLGGGLGDADVVADFATQLFDEIFEPGDVVHPQRLTLTKGSSAWSVSDEQLTALHNKWLDGSDGSVLADVCGRSASGGDMAVVLHELLHDEAHVVELQRRLDGGSRRVEKLRDIFDGFVEPERSLTQLIDLAMAARPRPDSASLLPARYHLWLSATEGMYACLHPDHPDGRPRMVLDRHVHCEACRAARVDSRMFEIAVCRHCRTHYLVGDLDSERLGHAPTHVRDLTYLVPGELQETALDVDEDESALSEDEEHGAGDVQSLCVSCGVLASRRASCGCDQPRQIAVTHAHPDRRQTQLKRCLSCKRHSPAGVAQRFLSGSEAPVAVVATSLYQSLPPAPAPTRRASAGGRKLLMFSDSRQDAAFFAPYLRRTYGRAVERHMLWGTLSSDTEPFRFDDLINPTVKAAERAGLLDEDDNPRTKRTEVAKWILAEVLATDRRQSLDGLGLAEILPRISVKLDPPTSLTAVGFDEDETFDVVRVLLDSVRQSAAVSVPDEVFVQDDLRFAPRNTTTRLRGSVSETGVLAWKPGRGTNRRTDYLNKLAGRRGVSLDPVAVLEELWDALTEPNGPMSKILIADHHPQFGTVFTINHEQIEFTTIEGGATPYRCGTCRQVWWRSVSGVCPTFKCDGTLDALEAPLDNHYLSLYKTLQPLALTVEEHTGQLRSQHAAELQERFVRGELNALSCSTTFELGVDLGEVQSILLRNVPPSASSYVQRAGRAGRRAGSAALVVAYAQRRGHDRSLYDRPESMIDGHVPPPVIQVDNDSIARRHVHAVAWSEFERNRVDAGRNASHTIRDLLDAPNGLVTTQFVDWLRTHPPSVLDALQRITPPNAAQRIGISTWEWVDRLVERDELGVGGWMLDLEQRSLEDRNELFELEERSSAEKNHKRAEAAKRTRNTLEQRRVLDVFAQRGVLPKYGFPVDVVDLDLARDPSGIRLELSRDLRMGILEFAPGGQIVAGNRLWRSVGIRQLRGRLLPEYEWGICDGCGVLRTELRVASDEPSAPPFEEPCEHCGSEDFERGRRGRFVIPLFGFIGKSDGEPGESRPPRDGFLETHFAEFEGSPPEERTIELGGTPVRSRQSRRGWITVFNRGRTTRGFSYCSSCGHASDEPPQRKRNASGPPSHKPPWGGLNDCRGRVRQVDLGHRFMTSVVELEVPLTQPQWERDTVARSVLYALIGASSKIGVSETDIGGSLAVGRGGSRTLIIFDDVPGGAGHARFISDHLKKLVEEAYERVARCSCGIDTSCYGCLRSYRNQLHHDSLVRAAAIGALGRILGVS